MAKGVMERSRLILIIVIFLVLGILSCAPQNTREESTPTVTKFSDVPAWSKEAIWYQIYPDIFRNGDPSNDPRKEDIVGSYPGHIPSDWHVTDWTQDWYQLNDYNEEIRGKTDLDGNPIQHWGQFNSLRHYGGDIQGIIDQIDYLDSLGVTALYINPLYDGPSNHNFDARNWRHIDINFGPDPDGDKAIMETETADDPNTWQWTTGDKLFLKLIDELHKRGIRIVMDYSWNHVGIKFWAWKDVIENQEGSKYADWFWVNRFDDPDTPENEFDYPAWLEIVRSLVQVKETEYVTHVPESHYWEGNFTSEKIKKHIFEVTRRWLDPNGDGDPSDGIDGYRLDVCAEVPLGFWRDYRKVVRDINPDAYLVGESWFGRYPDTMLDPEPALKGDVFDGVMNYRWFKASREFFVHPDYAIPATAFVDSLTRITSNIRQQNNLAMMNTGATHDSPRLLTSVFNYQNKYKYLAMPTAENDYKIHKPDAQAHQTAKLILAQQFTYIGAPHIWQGEEMGMWGADFPDCRKPMLWPEFDFDAERAHPIGRERPVDEVKLNQEVFDYYQKLITMRKNNSVLAHGEIEYLLADDDKQVVAYSRYNDTEEVIAVFNASTQSQRIDVSKRFNKEYTDLLNGLTVGLTEGSVNLTLPARSAAILAVL